jgi:hypothetical protein
MVTGVSKAQMDSLKDTKTRFNENLSPLPYPLLMEMIMVTTIIAIAIKMPGIKPANSISPTELLVETL